MLKNANFKNDSWNSQKLQQEYFKLTITSKKSNPKNDSWDSQKFTKQKSKNFRNTRLSLGIPKNFKIGEKNFLISRMILENPKFLQRQKILTWSKRLRTYMGSNIFSKIPGKLKKSKKRGKKSQTMMRRRRERRNWPASLAVPPSIIVIILIGSWQGEIKVRNLTGPPFLPGLIKNKKAVPNFFWNKVSRYETIVGNT